MGLTYDQLFPGRFIKAGEMDGKPTTLTIKDVYLDQLEGEDGREKPQAVVAFEQINREWALNKTNAQCLVAMWGPDSGEWIGKRVTLFPENDASGLSDSGVCIRIKGSPDISKPITATVKLPRRRPVTRKLAPTQANGDGDRRSNGDEQGAATPPAAEPEIAEPDFIRDEAPLVDENGEVVGQPVKPVSDWQRTRLSGLGWSDEAIAQMDYAAAKVRIDGKQQPTGAEGQGGLL